ncbi:MAG: AMP-binding protein [Pseudomonadota bacterium]|nr:AMP-binding protein [Pseudomonadota bacterium]
MNAPTMTAHEDTFARDHLPPMDQWPQFVFDGPELQYPERMNAAAELLDAAIARGWGQRTAIIAPQVGAAATFYRSGDVREGALRWSYAELQGRVNRIARVLVEDMHLVAGNRVLLRAPNSPMHAACWLAVVKAGGIAVGTMPLLRARELTEIIRKAEISHALCDARLVDELEAAKSQCPSLMRVINFGDDPQSGLLAAMQIKSANFQAVETARDDVALIAFTSGTTGKPKGTVHFHRDLVAVCDCFPRTLLRATADDIFTGSPPLAFTFGLGGLLLFPLRIGAATLLLEKSAPEFLLPAIARHRASVLFTAPTSYRSMAPQASSHDLTSLRKCVSAGEALPAATRALWKEATGIEIIDGIGSTELLHIFISHDEANARPGATGKPVPGYVACVMDDHGQPLPPGKVGRLAVKGPTGCRYLADDRQREYVRDGWNYTGDAYLVDADGYFVYQARTDDMIISAGYNIGGPEVESALLLHPAVAECGVIGSKDAERGQIVKAYVVLKPGHAADATMTRALQDFVKATIAPYKYPRAIRYESQLPRTETGKLQRFRLRQMDAEEAAPGSAT